MSTSPASIIQTDRHANVMGSVWMIAAMAIFTLEDALLKTISAQLPVGQTLILFGLGGTLFFGTSAYMRGERLFHADAMSPIMRIRMVFEIIGRLFYVLALALTSLSSATVILQATPLVVVLGAAIFFQEKVGWQRWAAICVGMIGVLIILRPTPEHFSLLSILAVIGMLGFAGRDLASRAAPMTLSTFALGFYGFLAVILAGVLFSVWDGKPFLWPEQSIMLTLVGVNVLGVVAYIALMKAMRTGEISTVTPFRYTRLLFGIAAGIFLFGETLDMSMALGSSLIVVSGIFILGQKKASSPEPQTNIG